MNDNIKSTEIPDMKVRFSALWLVAMLTYLLTYGEIDPVKQGPIQLNEGFLLGGFIYMMIILVL